MRLSLTDRRATNKLICMLALVILTIGASGCWDRREPKSLALVSSSLYDLTDSGTYIITTEIRNPASRASRDKGGSASSFTITGAGNSMPEAMRSLSRSMDKSIFGWQNRVRLISERFARSDIISVHDYLLRDHIADEKPLVLIVRDEEPRKVYAAALGLSQTVGDYLDDMSQTRAGVSVQSVFVDALSFIKDYYEEGKQPVAGVVYLIATPSDVAGIEPSDPQDGSNGAGKPYTMVNEGLAAFKDDKLVGYMDGTETRAYNFLTNSVKTAAINVLSDGGPTIISVDGSKVHIKTAAAGNQVMVDIKIEINASVLQEGGLKDISQAAPLETIEDQLNRQLEVEIASAVQKAQTEFQSDIFGFGRKMHIQHPDQWQQMKNNWDDYYFSNADIQVLVESSIDRSGSIEKPLRLEHQDG